MCIHVHVHAHVGVGVAVAVYMDFNYPVVGETDWAGRYLDSAFRRRFFKRSASVPVYRIDGGELGDNILPIPMGLVQ